tara:strand:+ start:5142 stop:5792 length:651 start_codon:yes stop_codon:yes gene_type:complete
MYKSSTDAYQGAVKIMSHEYANKYANYWSKKQKVIKTGKANFKDSGRQKTYNAEFAAIAEYRNKYPNDVKFKSLDWKQSQKYFKKIAKSKTYKDICIKQDASKPGVTKPILEKAHFRGATAGQATWYGSMRLAENNSPYTIVHEFAHLCGNMHHDIGFRRDVIKLSSRFLGTEFAKMLKGQFKKSKLKITVSQHIMSPEKWIESVIRMDKIRMERS